MAKSNSLAEEVTMIARIIDYNAGFRVVKDITGIRIHSKDYVLLIMADYMPTLGKISGNITFITDEEEVTYKDINGFYKHQYNEFTLLIEDEESEI